MHPQLFIVHNIWKFLFVEFLLCVSLQTYMWVFCVFSLRKYNHPTGCVLHLQTWIISASLIVPWMSISNLYPLPSLLAVGVLTTDFMLLWKTVMYNPARCYVLQLPKQVRQHLGTALRLLQKTLERGSHFLAF